MVTAYSVLRLVLHIVFGDGGHHSASTDESLGGYCSHWNTVLGCRSSHVNHEVYIFGSADSN